MEHLFKFQKGENDQRPEGVAPGTGKYAVKFRYFISTHLCSTSLELESRRLRKEET